MILTKKSVIILLRKGYVKNYVFNFAPCIIIKLSPETGTAKEIQNNNLNILPL